MSCWEIIASLNCLAAEEILFAPLVVFVATALVVASSVTARRANAQTPVNYVQPINWSKYNGMFGVRSYDTFGQGLVNVLQNESRYELTSIPAQYPVATDGNGYPGDEYYYAFTNYSTYGYEQSLRPLSGFAYGTAALIATGTYSPSVGGMSESAALHEVELAIRGVAFAHRANHQPTGLQFGGRGTSSDKWEAAVWAAQAAEAAWLVWDKLTPDTQTLVAKMVEYEGNSFPSYTVPYWKNPDGSTNSAGDTKAEENAWNGHMAAVAQAMMPNHPNAAAWRTKASELQISAYSQQSDDTSTKLVDGKAATDWLNGFNAFPDGVVVNHGRVHPDYMASIFGQTASVVTESLAGQYIPQSTVFNFDKTYAALTQLQFTPGPDTKYDTGRSINSPGGTIYKRTSNGGFDWAVYYPESNDWTDQVTDSYINTDLTAKWLELDKGKNFNSMGWAQAHVTQLGVLQNRPGHDGNIYQSGDWFNNYHGTDEVIYYSNAAAWLQWWLMSNQQMSPIGDHSGAPIPGDYNGDNQVDAADYLVWRSDPDAYGGSAGYDVWRANFGNSAGGGQGFSGECPGTQSVLFKCGRAGPNVFGEETEELTLVSGAAGEQGSRRVSSDDLLT